MRRIVLLASAVILAGTLGFSTAASATPATLPHIRVGSHWTLVLDGGGCEIFTFHTGNTWTADKNGDAGTYSGGRANLTMHWTRGSLSGGTFTGSYDRTYVEYMGAFTLGASYIAVVSRGATSGC